MKNFLLKSLFILFWLTTTAYSEEIKKIEITGNNRISNETIAVFGDIELNKDYSEKEVNELIKKLYDTDFFSNIEIAVNAGILKINVKENPIISTLVFNGIKAKKFKEPLLTIIELKEKTSFVQSKLDRDLIKVKTAFRNLGFYFVEVEVFKQENKNNSINLIYEINLGKRAKIAEIKFIGDKKYKDRKLRGIITSEENKFWKFLSTSKYLNQDRIDRDRRLLENFYKSKGYYQVQVLATNVSFENNEEFLLTYNINAGTRFKIKSVSLNISNTLQKDSFKEIEKDSSKLTKKYYSPHKIKKILDKINKLSEKQHLQFVSSELNETIDGDKLIVVIDVFEGPKSYVERINIIGNSVTNDNVIRGELELDEGDPYTSLMLGKSINNLKARNIFASVKETVQTGSTPDTKVISIEVEEKATGEISAGAGVGTSGGTFGFAVTENNFMGQGVRLDANLTVSEESIRGLFSAENPNYNYTGNSIRTTVESTKTTKMSTYGYDSSRTGFSLGTAFEQYEDVFISPEIATYYEKLDTDVNASKSLKKQQGTYFDTDVNYAIIKDKRDRSFQPSDGYRISFNQKIPLYSENPALLNGLDYSAYHSFSENLVTSIRFHGRVIKSIQDTDDVKISQRIYLPGRYLRGFEAGKIGPVDSTDYVGGNYATALGFNAQLPNALPTLSNLDINLFIDAANVWGVDYDAAIDDSNKIRSAFGISADWFTPIGPLNFSLAQDISKASTDKTESFRFNIGTTF